jgi:hypothetical protein
MRRFNQQYKFLLNRHVMSRWPVRKNLLRKRLNQSKQLHLR